VTVPRYLFEWVRDSRNGEWTVADTGMLVVMLQQFENRTPLIAGATFQEEDGEPVLVIPGAIGGDIRVQGRNLQVDESGRRNPSREYIAGGTITGGNIQVL
jgi:hypothetical protein